MRAKYVEQTNFLMHQSPENQNKREIFDVTRQNLMPLACAIFGVWIVLAIFSSRCLYADGAHEFIRVLQSQNFVTLMWSRHFAFYIYEFPLVIGIKLGVIDMGWLRFLFGLGCFLPWPIILLLCWQMSPKHLWIVVTACAAGYLNACYMAVGEHILAHALFWPALFAIVYCRPLTWLPAAVLLISATCLLFSYESQLFLGAILAMLCFWRLAVEMHHALISNGRLNWSWWILLLAGVLFLVAGGIGFYAIMYPEIPSNFGGFKGSVRGLFFHKGWTLTWSILWGCIMLAAAFSRKVCQLLCRPSSMVVLLFVLLLWGLAPLLAPNALEPDRQYYNRILNLLTPLILLPVVLISQKRPDWLESKIIYLNQLAAIFLMVQSIWQIGATWQWQKDIGKLEGILSSQNGIIPLNKTILATSSIEGWEQAFDWTWPCLSIAVNPDRQIHSLVWSELYLDPEYKNSRWQPFDPENPPRLEHYGLSFTNYFSILRNK